MKAGATTDIALLVEGTYPYVRGGVSSWIHQIITGLPEFNFSLIFLGSTPSAYAGLKFELPDNVVGLQEWYLMDQNSTLTPKPSKGKPVVMEKIECLHQRFKANDFQSDDRLIDAVFDSLLDPKGLQPADFFFSEAAWAHLQRSYLQYCKQTPFLTYFWTIRSIHGPIFKLTRAAQQIAPARMFHAISTGYAGFLGALLQHRTGSPLMLTEHGIYTKERRIDVQTMGLKSGPEAERPDIVAGMPYPDYLWIRFFEALGRFTYRSANPIVALYERNRQRQIADGARRERTRVVPNGVDLTHYAPLRQQRPEKTPKVIGLLGRIVPIKDIKTFIHAMSSVVARIPDAEAWLIGPTEEDPAYAQECSNLIRDLGLQNHVKFLGFQNPLGILPQLGLLILSSISEAFPLVLLEAFASGLPAITTDVGACREIIEGRDAEDRALGAAGRVVAFADPDALAKAMVELLSDEPTWRAAQTAAIARVEKYYGQDVILNQYRQMYLNTMAS